MGSAWILGTVGAGLLFWVVVIGIALAVFSEIFQRKILVFGPTLVLRQFHLNGLSRDGVFLRIVGRPSGLVSWLLTLLRLENQTTLEVNRERFLLRSASLYGEVHHVVPLTGIASINCGYSKPFHLLLIGALLLLIGLGSALGTLGEGRGTGEGVGLSVAVLFGFVLLAGPFALWYHLSRKLVLAVRSRGGDSHGLVFKPSVIEGVSVDLDRALQAMALIQRKVLEAQPSPIAEAAPPATSRPRQSLCPRCASILAPGEKFCGNCGASTVQ